MVLVSSLLINRVPGWRHKQGKGREVPDDRIPLKPQNFFLGFLCSCFSCFTATKATFTCILFLVFVFGSVVEYAYRVFRSNFIYLIRNKMPKRTLRIISGLPIVYILQDCTDTLCSELFSTLDPNNKHKLVELLCLRTLPHFMI